MTIGSTARRQVLGTFLLFLGIYSLTQSGRFHVIDEYETYFVAESMLERAALDIPQVEGSPFFFGKRGPDGRYHAPYGVGQPIMTLPFLALGMAIEVVLPEPSPDRHAWRWFFSSLSSAFYSALAVAFFQIWLLRRGLDRRRALWAAILLGAGTLVWVYAAQYRSNTLVLMLLLALLLFGESDRLFPRVLAVALGALAVLVRTDALIGVGLIGIYHAAASWPRIVETIQRCLPHVIGGACGLIIAWTVNWLRYGSPFDSGYPPVDDLGRPSYGFGTPDPVAMLALLCSPGKGLFLLSPILLLAAVKFPAFFRRHPREGALSLAMGLSSLVLFSAWQHYEGGWCFGPRFLLPIIPFILMPLAFLPARRLWSSMALAAGVSINLLAVSVNYLAVARQGHYYLNLTDPLRPLTYNFFHNPFPAQTWEAFRGWGGLFAGKAAEGALGEGLDFWWLFVLKESVPLGVVLFLVVLELVVLGVGLGMLWSTRAKTPPLVPKMSVEEAPTAEPEKDPVSCHN